MSDIPGIPKFDSAVSMRLSLTEKVLDMALRACCENRLRMDTFSLFLGSLETSHFTHSRVFAKNIECFQYKLDESHALPYGGKKVGSVSEVTIA